MKSQKLIRSYPAKNHVDENVSAICITANNHLKKVFAGYHYFLQIIDLEKTHHEHIKIQLKDDISNKFIKTIVSSIAIDPLNTTQYAYGCYNKSIYIADTRTNNSSLILNTVDNLYNRIDA